MTPAHIPEMLMDLSATALDALPFLILPLLEKLGPAQWAGALMVLTVRMTARMVLKIAFVGVIAAEAANGFPDGSQML